jgi:hypothetical protein
MSGRNGSSEYFDVSGSGSRAYTVTINYDTGHFCTCRGMLSKKSTYGEDAGRTTGTSCKHVKDIIKSKFDDDWGSPGGKGKPRTRKTKGTPKSPEPTGRRAAILAQRAKRKERSVPEKPNTTIPIMDRIAALAASRE